MNTKSACQPELLTLPTILTRREEHLITGKVFMMGTIRYLRTISIGSVLKTSVD